jgi:hypothetical protein
MTARSPPPGSGLTWPRRDSAERYCASHAHVSGPGTGYSHPPGSCGRTEGSAAADVAAFGDRDEAIISICHGAQLLDSADVLAGRRASGYWTLEVDIENAGAEYVAEPVVDDDLVTSQVPDDLPVFMDGALRLVNADLNTKPAAARV